MREYTLGLDARLSGVAHTGIGRYIKNLALRLPFVLPDNYRLVYFLSDKTQWSEILADLSSLNLPPSVKAGQIFKRIKIVIAPVGHYSLAEQRLMPGILAREKLDLLHAPHFNLPYLTKVPKIVMTVHDLTWHVHQGLAATTLPWWQYYPKYLAYKILLSLVIKKAQVIITPSQQVQKQLLHYYPASSQKTRVIYNGVNDFIKLKAQAPALKLPKHYLLYVGSLYPHKNLDLLLAGLRARPNLKLVIVSARDVFYQKLQAKINKLKLNSQITFAGRVSDNELKYLYQHAQALVQPSLAEGFGLTGVEALKLGTPVLASAIPVFSEIYGSTALTFNPKSTTSFLTTLDQLNRLNYQRWRLAAAKATAAYNWDLCARRVGEVYQELLDA